MRTTTFLFIGAAILATPVLAQAATATDTAPTPSSQAMAPSDSSNTAGTQTAMNDNSAPTASASADDSLGASAVSSIPDTEKKYSASNRASDFQKEAQTTKELNQQIASANGITKTQQ